MNQIRFCCFLKCQQSRCLPPQSDTITVIAIIRRHVHSDFTNLRHSNSVPVSLEATEFSTHNSGERQLSEQQIRRLLIFPNLSERNRPGPKAWFLARRARLHTCRLAHATPARITCPRGCKNSRWPASCTFARSRLGTAGSRTCRRTTSSCSFAGPASVRSRDSSTDTTLALLHRRHDVSRQKGRALRRKE